MTRLVFWFFLQPTAKTHAPIFMIGMSDDDVLCKDVPLGSQKKILHFDPIFPQNTNFWAILTGLQKFHIIRALTMVMLTC